jgi:hypothetical protein
MTFDDNYAIELLYSLAQKQPYRQPASYTPSWFEFKVMFKNHHKVEFVPDMTLKHSRSWQPDLRLEKN